MDVIGLCSQAVSLILGMLLKETICAFPKAACLEDSDSSSAIELQY